MTPQEKRYSVLHNVHLKYVMDYLDVWYQANKNGGFAEAFASSHFLKLHYECYLKSLERPIVEIANDKRNENDT